MIMTEKKKKKIIANFGIQDIHISKQVDESIRSYFSSFAHSKLINLIYSGWRDAALVALELASSAAVDNTINKVMFHFARFFRIC